MITPQQLAENIRGVKQRIKEALEEAHRSDEVKIIAVTKTRSPQEINLLTDYGIFSIGENRVQELMDKIDSLDKRFDIQVIGQLQRNKVKYIIDRVNCVQSLDREELAFELNRRAAALGKRLDVLIEVRLNDDPARGGVAPEKFETFCVNMKRFESLNICGIMAVAPPGLSKSERVAAFGKAACLMPTLKEVFPEADRLSMGMSADYYEAILAGATEIRLGSALFGPRENMPNGLNRNII